MTAPGPDSPVLDAIVVGAGQAGLAASFHLRALGIDHVVLDAEDGPGGAWRHRWDSLTMRDVHGVADLPGELAPPRSSERANLVIPGYFGVYEARHGLPVRRPVRVLRVEDDPDGARGTDGRALLRVTVLDHRAVASDWGEGVRAEGMQSEDAAGAAGAVGAPDAADGAGARTRSLLARTLISATGTWTRPFVPAVPGAADFTGEQFHTASYPGADALRGRRVMVVGGGASAVQFLGEIAPVADTLWVTRRPPQWRDGGEIEGLAAVTEVERRAVLGEAPRSVVAATGLVLREQEQAARALGAYDHPLPMFERLVPEGARWADGRVERVDVILWATGFRPATQHLAPQHLAPLRLRSPRGGIALRRVPGNVQGATTAAADERIQLVGYGPSASTIGASRAARQAARAVAALVRASADAR